MKVQVKLLDSIENLDILKPFWQFYMNAAFETAVLKPSEEVDYKKAVAIISKAIDKAISENLVKFDLSGNIPLQVCCMNVVKTSQATVSFTQVGPFDDEVELKKFMSFIAGFLCGLNDTEQLIMSIAMCHKDIFKMFKKSLKKHLSKLLGKDKFEIIS